MNPGTPRSDRLLAHLRDCVAAAERVATPEELVAAKTALNQPRHAVQRPLFNPQHAHLGVAPQGQPDPAGCVSALARNPE